MMKNLIGICLEVFLLCKKIKCEEILMKFEDGTETVSNVFKEYIFKRIREQCPENSNYHPKKPKFSPKEVDLKGISFQTFERIKKMIQSNNPDLQLQTRKESMELIRGLEYLKVDTYCAERFWINYIRFALQYPVLNNEDLIKYLNIFDLFLEEINDKKVSNNLIIDILQRVFYFTKNDNVYIVQILYFYSDLIGEEMNIEELYDEKCKKMEFEVILYETYFTTFKPAKAEAFLRKICEIKVINFFLRDKNYKLKINIDTNGDLLFCDMEFIDIKSLMKNACSIEFEFVDAYEDCLFDSEKLKNFVMFAERDVILKLNTQLSDRISSELYKLFEGLKNIKLVEYESMLSNESENLQIKEDIAANIEEIWLSNILITDDLLSNLEKSKKLERINLKIQDGCNHDTLSKISKTCYNHTMEKMVRVEVTVEQWTQFFLCFDYNDRCKLEHMKLCYEEALKDDLEKFLENDYVRSNLRHLDIDFLQLEEQMIVSLGKFKNLKLLSLKNLEISRIENFGPINNLRNTYKILHIVVYENECFSMTFYNLESLIPPEKFGISIEDADIILTPKTLIILENLEFFRIDFYSDGIYDYSFLKKTKNLKKLSIRISNNSQNMANHVSVILNTNNIKSSLIQLNIKFCFRSNDATFNLAPISSYSKLKHLKIIFFQEGNFPFIAKLEGPSFETISIESKIRPLIFEIIREIPTLKSIKVAISSEELHYLMRSDFFNGKKIENVIIAEFYAHTRLCHKHDLVYLLDLVKVFPSLQFLTLTSNMKDDNRITNFPINLKNELLKIENLTFIYSNV